MRLITMRILSIQSLDLLFRGSYRFDGGAPLAAWIIWVSVQLEIMEGRENTPCSDLSLSESASMRIEMIRLLDQQIRHEEAFESMLVITLLATFRICC